MQHFHFQIGRCKGSAKRDSMASAFPGAPAGQNGREQSAAVGGDPPQPGVPEAAAPGPSSDAQAVAAAAAVATKDGLEIEPGAAAAAAGATSAAQAGKGEEGEEAGAEKPDRRAAWKARLEKAQAWTE